MAYHFRNLVFEGGGVKGIAYVGALQVLEEKKILPGIIRVGGTSAGAINAVLVGLNYSPAETQQILGRMNFEKFMDDDFGVVRDVDRLLSEFGWYKGDFFRKWLGELIANKAGHADVTFDQVQQQKAAKGFRDMYFMGTNISTHFAEVFSHEHTPRMCLADAARISMSIPLFSHPDAAPAATSMWMAACWTITRSSSSTGSATWTAPTWPATAGSPNTIKNTTPGSKEGSSTSARTSTTRKHWDFAWIQRGRSPHFATRPSRWPSPSTIFSTTPAICSKPL